jgi:hypothetical protein
MWTEDAVLIPFTRRRASAAIHCDKSRIRKISPCWTTKPPGARLDLPTDRTTGKAFIRRHPAGHECDGGNNRPRNADENERSAAGARFDAGPRQDAHANAPGQRGNSAENHAAANQRTPHSIRIAAAESDQCRHNHLPVDQQAAQVDQPETKLSLRGPCPPLDGPDHQPHRS